MTNQKAQKIGFDVVEIGILGALFLRNTLGIPTIWQYFLVATFMTITILMPLCVIRDTLLEIRDSLRKASDPK